MMKKRVSQIDQKRPRAGRHRDCSKHQAILQATRELIEVKGYKGLSIKAIANRANVSRNVLYNWWDGKIYSIAEEALLPNDGDWIVPDTGNFKDDIESLLDQIIKAQHKSDSLKGFLILAAEAVDNNDELKETSRYFKAPYAHSITKIVRNAKARNEVNNNTNANHLAQIIAGSLLQFAVSKSPGLRASKAIVSQLIRSFAAK